MGDLEGLKKVLRSLVVSTPTTMDAGTLLRDYRRMLGEPLPCARHGYRDPVLFLRERCSDCFLFQGPAANPVLTLIVPDTIKHIDQYVQRQRMPTKNIRGKRRSVPESIVRNPHTNLITSTFKKEPHDNGIIERRPANIRPVNSSPSIGRPVSTPVAPPVARAVINTTGQTAYADAPKPEPVTQRSAPIPVKAESASDLSEKELLSNGHATEEEGGAYSRQRLQRFLERRVPAYQAQHLGRSHESVPDEDSGRHTSSSLSSRSAAALTTLQAEIERLVARRPGGLWCSELLRLYEEEYGRELAFARFRYPSVSACACDVPGVAATRAAHGDWLLRARGPSPSPAPAAPAAPAPAAAARVRRAREPAARAGQALLDPDDALPGIDYEPDVFPADCLSFLESIPAGSVADVTPGDMLQLVVGEVYSPSHLWVLRLGAEHNQMEDIMDEMTEYYTKGEGKERVLAAGARRPGQYCSSVFDGDWHRSLIVQIVDSDTVKVRHVDYGTVDTVAAAALRPLRRAWAALPARAVRARLAGLRPAARSRRWPRAAAAACLALVRDRRLVGNVVCVDREENILELFLIDTSTEEDVNITDELIRAGHADPRPQPALGARESYLFPLFRALEAGATPNYAEIHALLRDGIALEFVDAYRAHVPALLPSDDDSAASSEPDPPEPPPLAVANRVPLLPVPRPSGPRPETPPSPRYCDSATDSASRDTLAPDSAPAVDSNPATVMNSVASVPTIVPTSEVAVSSEAVSHSTVVSSPAIAHNSAVDPRPASAPSSALPPSAEMTPSRAPCATSSAAVPSWIAKPPWNLAPPPASAPASAPAPTPATPPPCCSARAPHPQSFYALPYCPCSKAGAACCSRPAPPPPPPPVAAYAFPPPPSPFVFGARPFHGSYYGGGLLPTPASYGPGAGGAGGAGAGGAVRLSAQECEVFELLSRVNPGAAHRYMMDALRRARASCGVPAPAPAPAPPALNPNAAEFRLTMRPPPGFEHSFR